MPPSVFFRFFKVLFAGCLVLLAAAAPVLAAGFDPNANDAIYAMAVQPDRKIVTAGVFTTMGGVTRNRVARLNANGTLDTVFNPDANQYINAVALQPDGRILIAGMFTAVGGETHNRIARLNADGTVDSAFTTSVSEEVYCLALQPDGKILIGGFFTSVNGAPRNYIARLNDDGSLDSAFDPNANEAVWSIVVQGDGAIVIGGVFTDVGGTGRNHIARLFSTGTLDLTFNPDADFNVYTLALQPDGKIVLGGAFSAVGATNRNRLARVASDGSVDAAFDPDVNDAVWSLSLQSDGKVLFGGVFTAVGATPRFNLARVDANGALDVAFDPNPNDGVWSIAQLSTARFLIGGAFTAVGGTARNHLARLNTDGTVDTGALSRIGVYSDGYWYLDTNQSWDWNGTPTDLFGIFGVGLTGAVPVAGDWNGDGKTEIGVYIDGVWYLDVNHSWDWNGTTIDALYFFGGGVPNAIPVAGDWTGDGVTKIGIYSNGYWYIDTNGNGQWDGPVTDALLTFGGGLTGAIPVVGDWNGDGRSKVGVYYEGYWYIDTNGNGQWDGSPTDTLIAFGGGVPNAVPIAGDWTGDGASKISIFSNGIWYVDLNNNQAWDGVSVDILGYFGGGLPNVMPTSGDW
jgi:uncharacterized delta-60 repeat protein